jgi:hypothetical protein
LSTRLDYINRTPWSSKPFFVWFNTIHIHIWTDLEADSRGKAERGNNADGMVTNPPFRYI